MFDLIFSEDGFVNSDDNSDTFSDSDTAGEGEDSSFDERSISHKTLCECLSMPFDTLTLEQQNFDIEMLSLLESLKTVVMRFEEAVKNQRGGSLSASSSADLLESLHRFEGKMLNAKRVSECPFCEDDVMYCEHYILLPSSPVLNNIEITGNWPQTSSKVDLVEFEEIEEA